MNFCDELRAACKGIARGIASVGEISRSNFFYFSRHVTHFTENSVGSSAPLFRLAITFVCEHRETLFDRIANYVGEVNFYSRLSYSSSSGQSVPWFPVQGLHIIKHQSWGLSTLKDMA
jgi:hypothetical protein